MEELYIKFLSWYIDAAPSEDYVNLLDEIYLRPENADSQLLMDLELCTSSKEKTYKTFWQSIDFEPSAWDKERIVRLIVDLLKQIYNRSSDVPGTLLQGRKIYDIIPLSLKEFEPMKYLAHAVVYMGVKSIGPNSNITRDKFFDCIYYYSMDADTIDVRRLRKEQIIHLTVTFLITALLIVSGMLLLKVSRYFSLLIVNGVFLGVGWLWALIWSLVYIRHPLIKVELDHASSTVKINDDVYDVYNDRYFFVPDEGVHRFLPFFGRNLWVTDDEGRPLRKYYVGPVGSRHASRIRKRVVYMLELFDHRVLERSAEDYVTEELEQGLGVVRISFPGRSISEHFYKISAIGLTAGTIGYILTLLPASFYEREGLTEAILLLKIVAPIEILLCLLMTATFWLSYRLLAHTIEIRNGMININGRTYYRQEVKSLYTVNANTSPLYQDEMDSWLIIKGRGKLYRYYLGQANNKKCIEPRRRLHAATRVFWNGEYEE